MQEKKDEGKNAGRMMVAGPSLFKHDRHRRALRHSLSAFNKLPSQSSPRASLGLPTSSVLGGPLLEVEKGWSHIFLQEVRLGLSGLEGAVQQLEQITGIPRHQDHQRRDEVAKRCG